MLKYLQNRREFEKIRCVGFDLDGTLYDEYEFIEQAYRPISRILGDMVGEEPEKMHQRLLKRWIEVGSSYNSLFSEILSDAGISGATKRKIIDECISAFRKVKPKLRLSARVSEELDWLSERYPLFLITDGSESLQQAKIDALGLKRWIAKQNISISGSLQGGISKPDPRMTLPVKLLNNGKLHSESILYFGDREVDRVFAHNCGYQFVFVRVMSPVRENEL